MHRPSQSWTLLSVDYLMKFIDVVQYLLRMCSYGVVLGILIEPHSDHT